MTSLYADVPQPRPIVTFKMSFRTILFFAVAGLLVSAPILITKARQNPDGSNASGILENGTAGQNLAESDSGVGAFFTRMFGGDSEDSEPNNGSPFQLAGSGGQSVNDTVSMMGNNTSTAPPNGTFSEPVYFAFANLNEFLRFDIDPEWVKFRWPRVSTFPAEDNLTGLRVAVISGPRPRDIHGSLTYYFDGQQRVQRIGFRGWTGDAAELVQLVQQMGLVRKKSNGAALFANSSWGRIKGAMRLDHPPITQKDRPTEQLMVLLELVNPQSSLNVSQPTLAILKAMEAKAP